MTIPKLRSAINRLYGAPTRAKLEVAQHIGAVENGSRQTGTAMRTLLTTNDLVRISFLHALLRDAGIECLLLDSHASAVEGSIGAIPRRLMVPKEFEAAARRVLKEAGEA